MLFPRAGPIQHSFRLKYEASHGPAIGGTEQFAFAGGSAAKAK
jgi:hypothetical protein